MYIGLLYLVSPLKPGYASRGKKTKGWILKQHFAKILICQVGKFELKKSRRPNWAQMKQDQVTTSIFRYISLPFT